MKLSSTLFASAFFAACANGAPNHETGSDTPEEATFGLFDDVSALGNESSYINDFRRRENPSGKKFTVSQVSNPKHKPLDAQSALLKAYAKYSTKLPPGMEAAVQQNPKLNQKFQFFYQKTATIGSVPAYPDEWESEYVIPVQIGTPPQEIYMNLDTGSADFWCFSTDTYPSQSAGHTLYRPAQSKTSKWLRGFSWNIRYGDGAGAGGIVYTDRVQIGQTFVNTQAVESAVQVSSDISADKFSSGIIGLAFNSVNTVRPTQQKTYMDNIYSQLAQPIFTANLQKGKAGTYNFGYIDRSQFTGHISWTSIDKNSPFWRFTVSGYKVGIMPYQAYKWSAIVDTGTSLLLVPQAIVKAYYARVWRARFDKYQGMWVFPCTSFTPDFVFSFGYYSGVVPGHYMNYGNMDRTWCYGGIQSSEDIGFAILGDVLLKAQYVVFDIRSKAVGFANKPTAPKGS